ncbi:hypothetical protein ACPPVO_22395 [Dactylosporangium sp. McL0621]|uniref:hypothetical protein n=1 Tax=Dactylosporangium sp. McL0621 TaxID=3415678 RepID=UPI003CE9653F
MIRPAWTPENDVQRRLADAVESQFRDVDNRESQAWRTFAEARDAGVPVTHLVERSQRPRATAYRKLDEMGLGNPARRSWTLTTHSSVGMVFFKTAMAAAGVRGRPVKDDDLIALTLSGDDGRADLEKVLSKLAEKGCRAGIRESFPE